MFRVRTFRQDDGHIFCRPDQVQSEIEYTLSCIEMIYSKFGFSDIEMALSTRPEKNFIGTVLEWSTAESSLVSALDRSGKKWVVKNGDGAFYGPKIDVMVKDALGRSHQTATIQLDFQLPQRFDLQYQNTEGALLRPVIIHRAILGSFERMLGILIEHFGGRWPFWLSPRQILIATTRCDEQIEAYALKVRDLLTEYHVDCDFSDRLLGKKIFDANTLGFNFVILIGDKEMQTESITIRTQDGNNFAISREEVFNYFQKLNT
jgi:threonyl-tRNA synthetase